MTDCYILYNGIQIQLYVSSVPVYFFFQSGGGEAQLSELQYRLQSINQALTQTGLLFRIITLWSKYKKGVQKKRVSSPESICIHSKTLQKQLFLVLI